MINAKLKDTEPLTFKSTNTEPSFDFAVRKYRTMSAADGKDFQVAIFGDGFEASRNLNSDELMMIRDWIDEVLLAQSEAA